MSTQLPSATAETEIEPERSYIGPFIRLMVLGVILFMPFRILANAFMPPDDALRHAAKAASTREWRDVVIIREGFPDEYHPGWDLVLRKVHSSFGLDKLGLVRLSVVGLFILFSLPAVLLLRRPETWLVVLFAMELTSGNLGRQLLGRPYIVPMAVVALLCLLWERLDSPRTPWGWLALLTAAYAAACWIHPSWYLHAIPLAALFLAGRFRAGLRATLCAGVGVLVGAVLTGNPIGFFVLSIGHPLRVFGGYQLQRQLVTELQPSSGDPQVVLLFLLLVLWRSRSTDGISPLRDPSFVLAGIGYFLGFVANRFWVDWGVVGVCVWSARQLEAALSDHLPYRNLLRLLAALGVCVTTYLAITGDERGRWSNLSLGKQLDVDDPEQQEWLPEPGGLFYGDSMLTFFRTYYSNPEAPWRYVLSMEPGIMPESDLDIYRQIQLTNGAPETYAPWVAKMTQRDRMVLASSSSSRPRIQGLEWAHLADKYWVGRKPREQPTHSEADAAR